MKIIESCVDCLYERQTKITDNEEYLKEIRNILDNRDEDDTSPYLGFLFNQVYERYFGKKPSFRSINKKYNDMVLSMEDSIKRKIEASEDPLISSLTYARCGNYIDFGAMNDVSDDKFLSLLDEVKIRDEDMPVVNSFLDQCSKAKSFLLITDNCGEIVLDRFFLEQLKKSFPNLEITVMVRGAEISNDAIMEDAIDAGIDKISKVITNGQPIAGTVYKMLPDDAKHVLDNSEVILSKGQGNYESLNGRGRHIFYSFLCKCPLFINRFNVPRFTGLFVEE